MFKRNKLMAFVGIIGLGGSLLAPLTAEAHCDTHAGPTYEALQNAIEENDFNHISYWVLPDSEAELKSTFDTTMSVMSKTEDEETLQLAEDYLFENFVRLHRAGEGAPYTGISDEAVDEGVALADQSITAESLQPLEDGGFITDENRTHVEAVFATLLERIDFDVEDTEAGRAYVESYVEFTHLFESGHAEDVEHHEGH
ncbi:DUF6448 family protein [Fundicoccus culcitae]|uniref:DUF6448 family protein n=1 Tax=Fundicoccus culcitae TaxID=2969821 RepID=A0ABY5P3W1_9LACT|nr:DUF6448 family protein [Fundicoccus culcitae]UUX33429.1 DUF6448 family protein [Fundicoccus culcitae]